MSYIDDFAASMLKRKVGDDSNSSIDQGCTYIGQMIAHDIVLPTSKINKPARSSLSWALNFNSLYDDLNDDGLFDYATINTTNSAAVAYDFIRRKSSSSKHYAAKISENRNAENAIISQLHVFWQRLHNKLVQVHGYKSKEAQRSVTLAFQLVVIHDFLHQTLNSRVFDQYFIKNVTYLDDDLLKPNQTHVPDFFSNASFRFGHTMVRSSYQLSLNNVKNLSSLFKKNIPLAHDLAIDWEHFFYSQNSFPIDTEIADHLGKVPHNPKITPKHIIPKLNLEASQRLCAACFISSIKRNSDWDALVNDFEFKELVPKSIDQASFKEVEPELAKLTLWPYLLLEAQVQEDRNRLGVLGSVLNAEVLKIALQKAKYSVYKSTRNKSVYNLEATLKLMGFLGVSIRKFITENGDYVNFSRVNKIRIMKALIQFNQ